MAGMSSDFVRYDDAVARVLHCCGTRFKACVHFISSGVHALETERKGTSLGSNWTQEEIHNSKTYTYSWLT
jgi:hypothetical protein